jgi:type III pantothenate kinase
VIGVVDIGNSRIKWALAEAAVLAGGASAVPLERAESAVTALARAGNVDAVWVANVAGRETAKRFAELSRASLGVEPRFVATPAEGLGIRGAYADPATFGVDRWLALAAARRRTAGPVCVVDAGTAVTFDALDASGMHLGGLIIASPRLMADALCVRTDGIAAGADDAAWPPGIGLLASTTAEAVVRGGWLAVAAAVDRAIAVVAAALGAAPRVLLTGGGAGNLEQWLETDVDFEADLVLEGLALTAAQAR